MQIRYLPFLCALLSATLLSNGDALGSTSAATAKAESARKCLFPNSGKRAPDWVCGAKVEGWAITAVGTAEKSGAGIAFMEQMAAADARTRLAQSLRNSFRKRIATRDSVLTTRITHESLRGTRIIKRAFDPNGTLYVLVGLDEAGVKQLSDSIAAERPKQKHR